MDQSSLHRDTVIARHPALQPHWQCFGYDLAGLGVKPTALLKVGHRSERVGYALAEAGLPPASSDANELPPWHAWDDDAQAVLREPYRKQSVCSLLPGQGELTRFAVKIADFTDGFVVLALYCDETVASQLGRDIQALMRRQASLLGHAIVEIVRRRDAWMDGLMAAASDAIVFLIDRSKAVLRISDAAADMVRGGAGIEIGANGSLDFVRRPQMQRIAALLDAKFEKRRTGRTACSVQLDDGSTWVAELKAFGRDLDDLEQALANSKRSEVAMISMRTRSMVIPPSADLIRSALDLTKMEAVTLRALLDGRRVAEQAKGREVTIDAVRYQIKQLHKKTGCRNQTELGVLVASLVGFEASAEGVKRLRPKR